MDMEKSFEALQDRAIELARRDYQAAKAIGDDEAAYEALEHALRIQEVLVEDVYEKGSPRWLKGARNVCMFLVRLAALKGETTPAKAVRIAKDALDLLLTPELTAYFGAVVESEGAPAAEAEGQA